MTNECEAQEQDVCEWCGRPGTPWRPLAEYIISPPVDGYEVETGSMHRDCANEAARNMVI